MTEASLKALRQIQTIAANAIADHDVDEDQASPEIRKPLPRGAGKEFVRPLLDTFPLNDLFTTKDVQQRFRDRNPHYRISEQTISRALNDFAEEGLLAKVGSGWRIKSKLKIERGAA
jgi:hypothetical protein